jgi:valyl-tRNA synthetase
MDNPKEIELPPAYEPKNVEAHWYKEWEESGLFKASQTSTQPAFSMVMPPPNVTGRLHMGHALTYTLQDLLTRYKRMRGFNVLWLPGTDHAGIATQNVVEKELKKENKSRHDFGREAFVAKVWEWKEKYGEIINRTITQDRCLLRLDPRAFHHGRGFIQSGSGSFYYPLQRKADLQDYYLINWCPRCQTALSDIEVIHKPSNGSFYHIRYPYAADANRFLEVATTRPETLLGDTAVAVNPTDERYQALVGKSVILPLVNRQIPIIKDRLRG